MSGGLNKLMAIFMFALAQSEEEIIVKAIADLTIYLRDLKKYNEGNLFEPPEFPFSSTALVLAKYEVKGKSYNEVMEIARSRHQLITTAQEMEEMLTKNNLDHES